MGEFKVQKNILNNKYDFAIATRLLNEEEVRRRNGG